MEETILAIALDFRGAVAGKNLSNKQEKERRNMGSSGCKDTFGFARKSFGRRMAVRKLERLSELRQSQAIPFPRSALRDNIRP
jgi:hypothetical protein